MTVQQAVAALRRGTTDVTVRTLEDGRRAVREAFPQALERPGASVRSAYGSTEVGRAIRQYRSERSRLLMFHVDISRYRVDEILPAIRTERAEQEQAKLRADEAIAYITNQIVERQTRHGGATPGVRDDFNVRIEQLRTESRQHERRIVELRASESNFARDLPRYQAAEKEGLLYGHEPVDEDHAHRTVPHINVEGTRITVSGENESIAVTVYIANV
jgi:hypothetical protein